MISLDFTATSPNIRIFIFNCRHPEERRQGVLSLKGIVDSEIVLIKMVQDKSFNGIDDEDISSSFPFRDDNGIIRIGSRITESNDTIDSMNPMISPSEHPATEKNIFYNHPQACHDSDYEKETNREKNYSQMYQM
ncbi:hypothetical protein JTB14_035465 [Gonioctena quinquepunctata]|nr:hypothetical protein JTB14_035465 [Gonioctena quinquepunctata]